MGLELYIIGIRKLRKEEIKALTGKSVDEIEKSTYFSQVLNCRPTCGEYRCYNKLEGHLKSIRHMLSPVKDNRGNTVAVCWVERLGYYWHKDMNDRERIEMLLEDMGSSMDWDQSYHIVSYYFIRGYIDRDPILMDEKEEIITFLYG